MSATETSDLPSNLVYAVPGMSCGHCVAAIEGEVGKISGVSSVQVDLDAKLVTVVAAPGLDAAVRQAIDNAGYDIA